jgi:glycosyltransferase involved in cell wall biosynthesis
MDSRDAPEVSIVVPLYNEEESVAPLCRAVREALAGWDRSWELVLVDDGSRDGTLEALRGELSRDPRLRVLSLRRNSGQTLAMATGFVRSRGRVIVSMDGDLQNDPRDIPALVSRLDEGYDLVCGWRKDRKDAWLLRVFPSRVANWLIARLTGVPIHDNGCSLKAYRAELIRSLRLYSDMHRFLPALSSMAGARIAEVVVRHHPRTLGTSKYGIFRTPLVLGDMITIKMLTQFGSRPGAWFGILALPWLLLGVSACLAWAAGSMGFAFSDSVVLSSVGIMCVYLGGHLVSLALLAEVLLAHVDRRYFRHLASVLSSREERDPTAEGRVRS